MKFLIAPILISFFMPFAFAENVTCTSEDPNLKVRIAPTFIDPNFGSFEYLELRVEKKARDFQDRINFKTLIKRKRILEGFEYVGLIEKSDASLKIFSTTLNVKNIKATLYLNFNRPGERTFENLKCSIEGTPFPPFDECPQIGELNTALLKATRNYDLDKVQNLLACGANPIVKDESGCSPLLNLSNSGCGKSHPMQWTLANSSSSLGDEQLIEIIDIMLSRGAFADEVDPISKRSVLHHFTLTNKTSVISSLMEYEASDINAQDVFGNTPLIYAADSGDGHLVKTILDFNPDRTIRNKELKTAFNIAEERKFRHLLPLLETTEQEVVIEGRADGSCSPLTLQMESGSITLTLRASGKMFMLNIPKYDIELMASAGQEDEASFTLPSGETDFTCGVHGGKVYKGSFLVP